MVIDCFCLLSKLISSIISDAPGQASISPTASALVGQPVMLTCTVDDPGMLETTPFYAVIYVCA